MLFKNASPVLLLAISSCILNTKLSFLFGLTFAFYLYFVKKQKEEG